MSGSRITINEVRIAPSDPIPDNLDWDDAADLIRVAIQQMEAATNRQHGAGRAAIVSTDAVLVEQRGERRFIVTVVFRVSQIEAR